MNVSICVCTFGSDEWRGRGLDLGDALASLPGASEVQVHHAWDEGLAASRNYAASVASGEWLLFVDADDGLGDGYLAAMHATMRHWNLARRDDLRENPLLLVPTLQRIDAGGRCLGDPEIPAWGKPLIDENCCVIGTLIPRALFLEVGGFREWDAYEDWELVLRLVRAGTRLVPVPDAVYCQHVERGSRNQQPPAVLRAAYDAIRAEHEDGFDWADLAAYKVHAA